MKYNEKNKPCVCMQTQSTCYKGTNSMLPLGILLHSTGANNPNISRYVQPSNPADSRDTITLTELGKNKHGNDWNHITVKKGVNAWVGKLADGSVAAVQTMPWNYKPWGCGKGKKGSCNEKWIQFEICEDNLTDKSYFDKVYKEACELTAYLCKIANIDPKGIVEYEGIKVPTILCHKDAYKLGLGSNHGDVDYWFKKYGKSMETVRADVAALLKEPTVKTYEVVTEINKYSNAADAKAKKNNTGKYKPGTYYIFNKYPNGYDGMLNITNDKTGNSAGSWINPSENVVIVKPIEKPIVETKPEQPKPVAKPAITVTAPKENKILEWQKAAIVDGFKFPKYGADGKWGSECEAVAKKAVCKKQLVGYKYKNLTKIVQKTVGVTADGKFGSKTKEAVKKYQKAKKLTADGAVGLNTWKKILEAK